jgi:hypothetical protein
MAAAVDGFAAAVCRSSLNCYGMYIRSIFAVYSLLNFLDDMEVL